MVDVHLYVEGGPAEGKALRAQCQRGFSELVAGLVARRPRIIACGSRNDALARFEEALRINRSKLNLLLVDAEAPVASIDQPWEHLRARDRWSRPGDATDESAHLMVQTMETWLLADRGALERFFGPGFREAAIPAWPDLEAVPKVQLYRALAGATRACRRPYAKGGISFDVLATVDGAKVRDACPSFARFSRVLVGSLGAAAARS